MKKLVIRKQVVRDLDRMELIAVKGGQASIVCQTNLCTTAMSCTDPLGCLVQTGVNWTIAPA